VRAEKSNEVRHFAGHIERHDSKYEVAMCCWLRRSLLVLGEDIATPTLAVGAVMDAS
jgi:hypothetical protein